MSSSNGIYVIAEIASAHEGQAAFAKRLAALAAQTGADAVKLQIFRRDRLISRIHPKHASFGEIELSDAEWREVLAEAKALPADLIIEVYDEASLELAETAVAAAAYKIPTSDLSNYPFLRHLATTGKRLYLGVGGATRAEIRGAVETLRRAGAEDLVLLHGIQSFPTKLEDSQLAFIHELRLEYGLPVGYADHVDAEDREMARLLPAMAVAAGASVIEKHITDDRSRKGRDHYSSLNPDEFADFVRLMRLLPSVMGTPVEALSEAETTYRHLMKRQAVAHEDLSAGTAVGPDQVSFKRTNQAGLTPLDMEHYYGRVLRVAKAVDDPLTPEDFQ